MFFILMTNEEVDEDMQQLCRNDDQIYVIWYVQIRNVSVGAAEVKNMCRYLMKVNYLRCLSCFISYNFFWRMLLNLYRDLELLLTLSLTDSVSSFTGSLVANFSRILLKLIALCTLLWNWSIILVLTSYFSFKNLVILEFLFLVKSLYFPYSTETPSSSIRIWSFSSAKLISFSTMMIITPWDCFSLRMLSTSPADSGLKFLKGLSRMYTSDEEQKTLAKAIFWSWLWVKPD